MCSHTHTYSHTRTHKAFVVFLLVTSLLPLILQKEMTGSHAATHRWAVFLVSFVAWNAAVRASLQQTPSPMFGKVLPSNNYDQHYSAITVVLLAAHTAFHIDFLSIQLKAMCSFLIAFETLFIQCIKRLIFLLPLGPERIKHQRRGHVWRGGCNSLEAVGEMKSCFLLKKCLVCKWSFSSPPPVNRDAASMTVSCEQHEWSQWGWQWADDPN